MKFKEMWSKRPESVWHVTNIPVEKKMTKKQIKAEIKETLEFVRGQLSVRYTRVNGHEATGVVINKDRGICDPYPTFITLNNPEETRDLIEMLQDVLDGAYE